MNYFYSKNISKDFIFLEGQEMIHCTTVLRKKVDDVVIVVDGLGGIFHCKILKIHPDKCDLKIINKDRLDRKQDIHLIISPTKNHKRIDWMIEKIVEIGIYRVTFMICSNSIRQKINLDRLNKIALSAMKQTQNAFLPIIDNCLPFSKIFDIVDSKEKYIAHLNNKDTIHLHSTIKGHKKRCILIGPEGDFTKEEVEYSTNKGFEEVSLGISRLRTETSGIVAATILNL